MSSAFTKEDMELPEWVQDEYWDMLYQDTLMDWTTGKWKRDMTGAKIAWTPGPQKLP